ncbi:hypothetical protein [Flagellimonas flava]|uniref:Uncharacterized protein n=1 Tax=Flagellimonas flava TaxID=570519 RepID=A0A1M5KBI8_9FLAO|nr:hypothetical protein [Allomuricauda flava]SHG50155.1 hypothetical protein SAMN04488116_1489 [Allomuricauda flava]
MRGFLGLLTILLFLSCANEPKEIDLSELNPTLRAHSDEIISDFVQLASQDRLHEFREKGYVTPMVHMGITHGNGIYSMAPYQIREELGTNIKVKLIQVLDKGLVYTFNYKIASELSSNGEKQFAIDINKDNGLAKIYFFIKNEGEFDTENRWINLFSKEVFLRK